MEGQSENKTKSKRSRPRSSTSGTKVQKKFTPRKRQETESDNSCVLCAQEITIYAVGFCDHPICMRCSAKMRILCEQMDCSVCRKELNKVIYSKKCDKFSVLESLHLKKDLHHRGVFFTDINLRDEYSKLFLNTCTICDNNHTETTFNDLQRHMRKKHDLHYCDLCVKFNSNLVDEMKTYSRKDLGLHRRVGDEDDTSHKGHPNCEFCDERYYDNDMLLKHLRKDHYFCHFCDRAGANQYYDKYGNLRAHFRNEHFLCEEGNCAHEEFTGVFSTEMDFKAHRAKEHGSNLTREQQRAERSLTTADLGFQYSQPRGVRGRGQGYNNRRQDDDSSSKADDPELAHAIALSMQDTQNGRKYRVERPKERQQKKSAEPQQDVDLTKMDFPTLGADGGNATSVPIAAVATSEATTKPSQVDNASAATVVAFAAGISTGTNRYNENDFPALGGETKASTNTRWGASAATTSKPVSVNVPEKRFPGKKVNLNKSDFPTLGAPSKNQNSSTFWGNVVTVPKVKKKPTTVTLTPKQTVPNHQPYHKHVPKVVADTTSYSNDVTAPIRMGSSKHATYVSVQKNSSAIEDIEKPTEIPGVARGTNVKTVTADAFNMLSGQQNQNTTGIIKNQNYLVQDSDFPSLGGGSRPKGPFASSLPQKTNKKTKNNQKKSSKANGMISLATLGNDIASESMSNASTKQNKSKSRIKSDDEQLRVTPDSWESELTTTPIEWNKNEKSDKRMHQPSNSMMVADIEKTKNTFIAENGDFPSLAPVAAVNAKSKNRKKKKKKGPQTAEDINKHFPKSFVQIEQTNGSAIANIENSTKSLSLSSVFSTEQKSTTVTPKVPSQEKRLPPGIKRKPSDGDAQAKNTWLIQTVQLLCKDEETFAFFKSCSGRFRIGEITAREYCNDCINILGKDNFMAISSELVELLPEENKRKELLREISVT